MWLFLGHTDARAQSWTKYTYPTDGFEVEFAGDVRIVPVELTPEFRPRILRAVQYREDGDTYVYTVTVSLTRHGVEFEPGIRASFDGMNCKVVTHNAPLDGTMTRGRELRGT